MIRRSPKGHGSAALVRQGHSQANRSRYFLLLDGVSKYYELRDAENNPISMDVDQIKMLVFPVSGGNTGLPVGTPVLTNGVFQEVDVSLSGQTLELGRVGADYFNGYITGLDILFEGESIFRHSLSSRLSVSQIPNMVPAPEA